MPTDDVIDDKKDVIDDEIEKYYFNALSSLEECRKYSENDFEEKIVYLAAGAIGVSVLIPPTNSALSAVLLVFSWWTLAGTLIINLLSSHWIKERCKMIAGQIKKSKHAKKEHDYTQQITRLNQDSEKYNLYTIRLFAIGMVSLLGYATTNLHYSMKTKTHEKNGCFEWNDTSYTHERIREIKNSRGVDAPLFPTQGRDEKTKGENENDNDKDNRR